MALTKAQIKEFKEAKKPLKIHMILEMLPMI